MSEINDGVERVVESEPVPSVPSSEPAAPPPSPENRPAAVEEIKAESPPENTGGKKPRARKDPAAPKKSKATDKPIKNLPPGKENVPPSESAGTENAPSRVETKSSQPLSKTKIIAKPVNWDEVR